MRKLLKCEMDARRSGIGGGALQWKAEAPINDSGDSQLSQRTTECASALRFAASILLALLLCGCAAHKPAHPPRPLHLGPEHLQCDGFNHCEMVQSWLTPDNKPVLTPIGCLLAKAGITWIFGDRKSMCMDKNSGGARSIPTPSHKGENER